MFSRRGFLQVSGGAAGYLTLGKYVSVPLDQVSAAMGAADAAATPQAAPFFLFSRCREVAEGSRFSSALSIQDVREFLLQGKVDLHKVKAAQPPGQKLYWESLRLPEGLDWESVLNKKAQSMAHLHGMMQGLASLPPEEVIKGYEGYLNTAAEFYETPIDVMEYIFGGLPKTMDVAHMQDFFRHLPEEKQAFFELCRKKLSPEQAAGLELRFEETAARVALEEDEHYKKASQACVSRFVDTVAKAVEDGILKLEVKPSESGKTHFSLIFNTREFPEEACHYRIDASGMSVSESVKASLEDFQIMTLTDKDKTKWSTETHYDKTYHHDQGGWLIDSIDVESSEPLMQRIVGELMRKSADAHLSGLLEYSRLHNCVSCSSPMASLRPSEDSQQEYIVRFTPPQGTPQQITDARREFEMMTEEFFRLPSVLGIRPELDRSAPGGVRILLDREKYPQLVEKIQLLEHARQLLG